MPMYEHVDVLFVPINASSLELDAMFSTIKVLNIIII